MKKKHPHRGAPRRGLQFESLESRLLLSADLAPVADVLATEPSLVPAEHRALEAFDPAPSISMRLEAHELVFVDGAIADRDRLVADFMRATGADRPVEWSSSTRRATGSRRSAKRSRARTGLTAVHVLSHGARRRDPARRDDARRRDARRARGRDRRVGGRVRRRRRPAPLRLRRRGHRARAKPSSASSRASPAPTSPRATISPARRRSAATGTSSSRPARSKPPLAVRARHAAWGGLLATAGLDWDDRGDRLAGRDRRAEQLRRRRRERHGHR